MPRFARIAGELTGLVRRMASRNWRYDTVFGATNTLPEALFALRALAGMATLDDGPAIAEYEQAFARAAGTKHAVSFASGRMAFYALLEALNVGPGDEVIVPAFTCVVVPNAVLYRGATPVYADIDARTFNIDPAQVEAKLSDRTKVILAQHTFGLVCDVDALRAIAAPRGIAVVEDCAHALGAEASGRRVGSLATAGFFSTDHTKVIGTAAGGMATTDDDDLAAALRRVQGDAPFLPRRRVRRLLSVFVAEATLLRPNIAAVGRLVYAWLLRPGVFTGFFYDELLVTKPAEYPYPARLGEAQAKIGLSQLARLDDNLSRRRAIGLHYEAAVGAYAGLLAPGATNHAFLRYAFLVDDRDSWLQRLASVADTTTWYTSVLYGRDRELLDVGYTPGSCPVGEHAARHVVNLPVYPRLRDAERIVRQVG